MPWIFTDITYDRGDHVEQPMWVIDSEAMLRCFLDALPSEPPTTFHIDGIREGWGGFLAFGLWAYFWLGHAESHTGWKYTPTLPKAEDHLIILADSHESDLRPELLFTRIEVTELLIAEFLGRELPPFARRTLVDI